MDAAVERRSEASGGELSPARGEVGAGPRRLNLWADAVARPLTLKQVVTKGLPARGKLESSSARG